MRTPKIVATIGLTLTLFASTLPAQNDNGRPEVSPAVQHDTSPPLRDMHVPPRSDVPRERPLRLLPPGQANRNQPDPVVQSVPGPLVVATAGRSFAGVGNGDYGFVPNAAPPDTEGAVGATQYVQWVNESFAVFDKSTGAIAAGFPKAGNTLWSGFGGGCQTNNDGDPIVQYDKLNNRWIFTQFSVAAQPYLQCVAVSTTSDATGTYNRYAFAYGTQFPDYPKLGVWPDAYYISFNIFNNGSSFAGSKVCAYDGASMRSGAAATQQCFQLSTSFGGLLPSDWDGPANPPPAGSPNFFLNFGNNSLNLWKFHVDFAAPANTTLAGPANIPVAAFNAACNGGTCIPQSGTTQQLDSLGDRLMYRLAYRHFTDGHEALVVNHSVATGTGNVGVRWYELRSPNGAPTVFQSGTFAPDSNYRWMGSIAMDQFGGIALGYSVSSSSINPGIRYTGRASTDPKGTMQAENGVVTGTGSQTGGLSRWGDYSAMTVDPADDCTFWYTNEYLRTTGSFNWSTWINSFKLQGCGGTVTPDFSLSATPASQSVTQGGGASYTVTVASLNGFTGSVGLSVSGLPSGATATFSPTSISGSISSAMAVNTISTTPAGTYTLTISGTDGGTLTHTTTVTLIVTAPPDFSISASPGSVVTKRNSTATYTVTVTPSGGFSSPVAFSVTGTPPAAAFTFKPTSITGGSGSSILTVNTGTTAGTFTLTITGTVSGTTKSHSTSVSLKVH
jgi:hypothetical protein